MHKKYMEEIIKSGDKESMECLAYAFDMAMEHLEECNPEMYEKLEMKLYVAVNGKQLNEEMAEKIIMNMQPYHMQYTLEESKKIMKEYGLSLNPIDFWVVLNSACNDYKELFGDNLEMYVKYAKLFIEDEDAKPGKVFTYFIKIPK